MTYHTNKDIELWVAKGDGWSIPFKVYYGVHAGSEAAHLLCAVPIGMAQNDVLKRYFAFIGASEAKAGWLLDLSLLGKHFSKAAGLTPEFYFIWNGEAYANSASKPPEGHAESDSTERKKRKVPAAEKFIDHVAQGSGMDKSTLTLAWIAMCQAMPGWLLSGETLSFGFCKIVALPYRDNWKEILLARYPTLKKALMIKNAKRFMALAFTAASRMLRMTELTECRERRGRPTFTWCIEALHTTEWEQLCEQAEVNSAASVGPLAYVKRWANKVSMLEETIYEVLASKVQKETTPTCRVLWRRGERNLRFVQAAPTVIGSVQIAECDDGGSQSVDDFLGIEDSAQYLEEKASRMLSMSDVQSNEDVRLPRGDGDSGREDADGGMLVLHPAGSQVVGKDMLDEQHGTQERMAE